MYTTGLPLRRFRLLLLARTGCASVGVSSCTEAVVDGQARTRKQRTRRLRDDHP